MYLKVAECINNYYFFLQKTGGEKIFSKKKRLYQTFPKSNHTHTKYHCEISLGVFWAQHGSLVASSHLSVVILIPTALETLFSEANISSIRGYVAVIVINTIITFVPRDSGFLSQFCLNIFLYVIKKTSHTSNVVS